MDHSNNFRIFIKIEIFYNVLMIRKVFSMNLIDEKCIDHYILYEEVKIDNTKQKIHLQYSVNIARLSHIRTMTMYNKLNCFLKTYDTPIDNRKVQDIFNEIPNIILKYNIHKEDIEGVKEEVKDKRVWKEINWMSIRKDI